MKKTPNITKEDIYFYLKAFRLDKEKFFSFNRFTEKGAKQLYDCLYHFTGAKINGKSLTLFYDKNKGIQTGDFDGKPFDHTQIDSAQKLIDSINEVISFRNFAMEQIESTSDKDEFKFENLSIDEQRKYQETIKKAQLHIDELNEIGKHGEIEIMEVSSEVVDDLLRNFSFELRYKLETNEKELKELDKNDKKDNELER